MASTYNLRVVSVRVAGKKKPKWHSFVWLGSHAHSHQSYRQTGWPIRALCCLFITRLHWIDVGRYRLAHRDQSSCTHTYIRMLNLFSMVCLLWCVLDLHARRPTINSQIVTRRYMLAEKFEKFFIREIFQIFPGKRKENLILTGANSLIEGVESISNLSSDQRTSLWRTIGHCPIR